MMNDEDLLSELWESASSGREARRALAKLLRSHQGAGKKEIADIAAMLAWLETLAHPFDSTQPDAHFTASAVILDPTAQHVCLVRHTQLGLWLQPGGHADESDLGDLERTALREAIEETSLDLASHPSAPRPLDVDIHQFPEREGFPAHYHLDLRFLLVASNPDSLAHTPDESLAARWFSWKEVLELTEEDAMKRMLTKARKLVLHETDVRSAERMKP